MILFPELVLICNSIISQIWNLDESQTSLFWDRFARAVFTHTDVLCVEHPALCEGVLFSDFKNLCFHLLTIRRWTEKPFFVSLSFSTWRENQSVCSTCFLFFYMFDIFYSFSQRQSCLLVEFSTADSPLAFFCLVWNLKKTMFSQQLRAFQFDAWISPKNPSRMLGTAVLSLQTALNPGFPQIKTEHKLPFDY